MVHPNHPKPFDVGVAQNWDSWMVYYKVPFLEAECEKTEPEIWRESVSAENTAKQKV